MTDEKEDLPSIEVTEEKAKVDGYERRHIYVKGTTEEKAYELYKKVKDG